MTQPQVHVREAGAGPGVVCLHANASSSAQWRPLIERLAPRMHVLAPDLYGAGGTPEWPSDRVITLADEVSLLEPVFASAGARFALVGHSYGAAVALVAALAERRRISALVVYEPTLFGLVDADRAPPNDVDGIRDAVAGAVAALDRGDRDEAARPFIDYWGGEGAWERVPEHRKPAVAASTANVRRWAHALFREPTPLAAFAALDEVPVLMLSGGRSTAAAHGVSRLLASVLPHAERIEFAELGHMGPVSDPGAVDPVIAAFLERTIG
jgi:pimeloyl-ACP methyl ester carboxylesterase